VIFTAEFDPLADLREKPGELAGDFIVEAHAAGGLSMDGGGAIPVAGLPGNALDFLR
jgi:S-formylglutathione hydrolase FrmB